MIGNVTNPDDTVEEPDRPGWLGKEANRAWLYRIALALLVLAVTLKLVPLDVSDEIVNIVTAVLGIGSAGLATVNTSTKKES